MYLKPRTMLALMGASAAAGAVLFDQLRRPADQRTWEGHLGPVPYDFRLPTPERIRAKVWNKSTSHVVMPHVFGIGWSLNLYPLLHPKMLNA